MIAGFTLLLAGCGGSGGYAETPRLANPTMAMVDQPPLTMASQNAAYGAQRGATYAPPASDRPMPVQQASGSVPADMPTGNGPRGTSGEQRYDAVGYASWYGEEMGGGRTASGQPFDPAAITVAHNSLPLGSFVEITALDTGRTIVALVNDRGPGSSDRLMDLSRGAAQLLGITALAPVRVRLINPPPPDQMALRQGRAASPRIDAPQALLTALRHKLPTRSAPVAVARPASTRQAPIRATPSRTTPPRQAPGASYTAPGTAPSQPQAAPKLVVRGGGGLYVQVAALSNAARAQSLAASLGGRVVQAGSIFRVQIGPFANNALAQRARDDVARRGYGDARIVKTN
ncbi:septal ring lytic transglycosylase RlpA family protein [Sphingomonas sp. So64.6b]|uniref:septal ring lytic transglycosylase RlpA family protein n=1 Tax=Sphingomonas sp. So64.6b TaxID=2997354 RepID=UPI001603C0AD|nr:septal ring lytic transglycosylase RlpA family protein [Sphingomonas sp. So64.6b]QNA83908.1 septal ring lytic transglycosylase RlpA family protein [Sphingomonas sp. So64.6b]